MPKRTEGKALGKIVVERVQTGVRMEKRLVKVLKALAELYDLSLGDLLEGIVLHAFDGRAPFSEPSLRRIADLKRIYGLDLDSQASHRLIEHDPAPSGTPALPPPDPSAGPPGMPALPAATDPPADPPRAPATTNVPAGRGGAGKVR
jgi:hypothetical protein